MGEALPSMMARRARFFSSLAFRRIAAPDKRCPFCHYRKTDFVASRAWVMQVRRCPSCYLMFRWPKASERWNFHFYQHRYSQEGVTDLPNSFNALENAPDMGDRISIFNTLIPPPARVLDFGASWGYATAQLNKLGYSATGFEISKSRANYGRKYLGLDMLDSYEALNAFCPGVFDAIFTSHTLEHLPSLDTIFKQFARLLVSNGMLVIFVPNLGDGHGHLRSGWEPLVGEKHTIAFEASFFQTSLQSYFNMKTATNPYSVDRDTIVGNANGDGIELLAYGAKK
jgi:2-polyprenyl-3-methyl-5-hydroxy-6-metoxy-1,4-benzoquinol methylase